MVATARGHLNGHLNVIKYLVTKDADVNKANNNGYTPLMLAADNKVVATLLNNQKEGKNSGSQIFLSIALVIILPLFFSPYSKMRKGDAKKEIEDEITEIFQLLVSKLKYSDKSSLGDVVITARSDIKKIVLKLNNENLLSFIKEIFKSNQQNELKSPFVVEGSAIWYDTSKLPIEKNKDKQYVVATKVATNLKNYLDDIRNAIEGDEFKRLLNEEKMLKEQQIKQQQEEEEGEKLLNSIKREIAFLGAQLKEGENQLLQEEKKRDNLMLNGKEFRGSNIDGLEKKISKIEEKIKKAEKSLIATLKSQSNRITTPDKKKEKIQEVEKKEQELLKRAQIKDQQKFDASLQRYENYHREYKKAKDDPKKAGLFKKLMDKEDGRMKELAKRDSAAYTELLTRLQNEQAASRRTEEHRRLEERREEDQKEREERKKERDQKAPSKDGEDKENECSQEGSHRYYQVPQQVEKTLSLSDIESYRLLLLGLDQFNFKTVINNNSQVVASGPLNPLLNDEAKELASSTQRIIKSKQDQDHQSPDDKAQIIAREREERKIFHNLLDKVIKRVSLKSEFTENKANIRSLIYSFLCHCAGDQDSVARSYKKLEIKGEKVGTYTGSGHASGNSVKNLKALQNILKEFIPVKDSSKKKLFEDVTYSHLKDSLTRCYNIVNSSVISELSLSENLEVPKDDHSYIKDIFRDLFIQDDKENDFAKKLKDKFIEFVHGHIILGNISSTILSTKTEILDELKKQYKNDNFELLDQVIALSLDKENLKGEVADSLDVHSFDDFKEMMGDIYQNYKTKIQQKHINGQSCNPSTVLYQVRNATSAESSHEAGARL